MFEYKIVAIPRPQGSKRHFGRGIMVESSKHIKDWRAFARFKAESAMQDKQLIDKPEAVCVGVMYTFERPQSHFLKAGLRFSSPNLHIGTPDVDKLQRALFDSMTGLVFKDDSQISKVIAFKMYGPISQTHVFVGVESEWKEILSGVLSQEFTLECHSKSIRIGGP